MKSADVAMLAATVGIEGEALGTGARESADQVPAVVASGSVKWFDATRGFGFIVGDNGEGDILLHFSVLRDHNRRTLPEGTRVVCEVVERDLAAADPAEAAATHEALMGTFVRQLGALIGPTLTARLLAESGADGAPHKNQEEHKQ